MSSASSATPPFRATSASVYRRNLVETADRVLYSYATGTSRQIPGAAIVLFDAVLHTFDAWYFLGTMRHSVAHHLREEDALQLVALPSATPSSAPRRSRARSEHGEVLRSWAVRDRLPRGGELEIDDASLQVDTRARSARRAATQAARGGG
jgi:hypothetical protein